jgi:hypothetical protein
VNERDRKDERSPVRCDGFWCDVREPTAEVAELLDRGDDDWVELTGMPDERPIWLRASRVDYVEAVPTADDVEAERFDAWIARLMQTTPALRCWATAARRVTAAAAEPGDARRQRTDDCDAIVMKQDVGEATIRAGRIGFRLRPSRVRVARARS